MSRPLQPGLTENEFEVMKILWEGAPLKVAEILERISRKPKPAYTSLLTLVQAMERKGYIVHHADGKAYSYFPKLKESHFKASEIKRLTQRIFGGSPLALVMNLVKDDHFSSDEIKLPKQMLEKK
jgi:BlaI family penicillinase repressor